MSMSDHINEQVLQELFARKVLFFWKTAKLDSFVLSEREKQQAYRKYVTYYETRQRGTLFKLLHNVRYKAAERTASNR